LNGFGADSLCELREFLCVLCGFSFNHKARKEDTSPCFGVAKTSLSYL